MTNKIPGILNDETIILRYNPIFEYMERHRNQIKISDTDQDEIQHVLAMTVEEVQHGIDQVHTDKFILGTLPTDAPLNMHAALITLNSLTTFDSENYGLDEYIEEDLYKNQYLEKTAKTVAEGVSTALTNNLEELTTKAQITAQATEETLKTMPKI